MPKRTITTDQAPAAIGPYSQAIDTGNFVFTSGVIPVNPDTGAIPEGIEAQTEQVMENLVNLFKASGVTQRDVVKTTVFIKNMDDFNEVNEVYGFYFPENPPARSCVEVARLPKDVLIEVEAIAMKQR
ncbi:MAG: RidA family protein [Eubacterium sp.]|nr:RidA family protein [Eubacterium sp.]